MTQLHERLTQAFDDLFAANRSDFGSGPGYYGVRLESVADDGSEVELVLTFRSGVRYCCFEVGCHFYYFNMSGWRRLRRHMDSHGLEKLPLPVIRKARVVIERGAVSQPGVVAIPELCYVMERWEYEDGPWEPFTASLVRVTAIRDYLLSHGWVQYPYARPQGLYFEHSTLKTDDGHLLRMVIPSSETLGDYAYHVERIIRTLSQDEKRFEADVFHDLTQ